MSIFPCEWAVPGPAPGTESRPPESLGNTPLVGGPVCGPVCGPPWPNDDSRCVGLPWYEEEEEERSLFLSLSLSTGGGLFLSSMVIELDFPPRSSPPRGGKV